MRFASLVALMAALLLASSAGAQRGSGAKLEFHPNAAPAWSWANGSGCGYAAGSQVNISVQKPEALSFLAAMPNSDGCIAFAFTTDAPGTYLVEARQQVNNRWRLLASYNLPVE
jgi:hypothetical protein